MCEYCFKTCFKFNFDCAKSLLWCLGFSLVPSQCVGLLALQHVGSSFLDQGSNPCPLHWKEDCQPLYCQCSLILLILKSQSSLMLLCFIRACMTCPHPSLTPSHPLHCDLQTHQAGPCGSLSLECSSLIFLVLLLSPLPSPCLIFFFSYLFICI